MTATRVGITQGPEDPARFRVEILFSPGVVKHPMLEGDHLHTAPLVPLHKHLTCKQVVDTLNAAIGETPNDVAPGDYVVVVVEVVVAVVSGSVARCLKPLSPRAASPVWFVPPAVFRPRFCMHEVFCAPPSARAIGTLLLCGCKLWRGNGMVPACAPIPRPGCAALFSLN